MLHHIDQLPKKIRIVIVTVLVIGLICAVAFLQLSTTVVYTGTLPCADCAGIKTTLILNGNHTYELQSLYIDKGQPFTEKGSWTLAVKNNMQVYALTHNKAVSYYQIVNTSTLKMLDMTGHTINAPFSMELKKD